MVASFLDISYRKALFGEDERVNSCITLRLVGLSADRAAKMRAENQSWQAYYCRLVRREVEGQKERGAWDRLGWRAKPFRQTGTKQSLEFSRELQAGRSMWGGETEGREVAESEEQSKSTWMWEWCGMRFTKWPGFLCHCNFAWFVMPLHQGFTGLSQPSTVVCDPFPWHVPGYQHTSQANRLRPTHILCCTHHSWLILLQVKSHEERNCKVTG